MAHAIVSYLYYCGTYTIVELLFVWHLYKCGTFTSVAPALVLITGVARLYCTCSYNTQHNQYKAFSVSNIARLLYSPLPYLFHGSAHISDAKYEPLCS